MKTAWEKNENDPLLEYLLRLPEAPELARVHRAKETVNGYFNYGNAGGYKTELASDSRTIQFESTMGAVVTGDGRTFPFQLPGHCSAVVERADHFYLIHSDQFAEISPEASILFDSSTAPATAGIFGGALRLKNCYRHQQTIFTAYWWVGGAPYPGGLLRFDSGRGFTARWQEP